MALLVFSKNQYVTHLTCSAIRNCA
jgi:hypothetical protein